jgi:hypothetical protein
MIFLCWPGGVVMKIMRRVPDFLFCTASVLLLMTGTISAYANTKLISDMVHFDQAYIPVLAMTSAGEVKASRKALKTLEVEWQKFKSRHYSTPYDDSSWKADLDRVDAKINAAREIILAGDNVKDAHEVLEHVRVIFMELRARNQIDYFIDHLTRFHEPMEKIVLSVKDKAPDSLSAKDLDGIKHALPVAMALWKTTLASDFDAALFEFNNDQVVLLRTLLQKEELSLERLEQALKQDDKQEIIQAGLAIKPNFAKLFKSFGHFPEK